MSQDKDKKSLPNAGGLSRRGFFKGMGTGLVGTAAISQALCSRGPDKSAGLAEGEEFETAVVSFTLNGQKVSREISADTILLDLLREDLKHTGTKRVCDRGECGACTVIVDGRTAYACMMLALDAQGAEIVTIEGLASGEKLHPVQEKFIEKDAYMCGFCTPGFEMSLKDLLDKNPHPSLDEIKAGLAGNVCRCGAYPHIFEVALDLAGTPKGGA